MPMNTWSNNSNVVNFPFKTLMTVNIETGTVSFNHPFVDTFEILDLMDWLMANNVEDLSIKDAYGNSIKNIHSLIGETTITLWHEAIALIGKTLELVNPKARKIVNEGRDNVSLILTA